MKVELTGRYLTGLKRLHDQDAMIGRDVVVAIRRFEKNHKDTRLRVHSLKRKLRGKHAFSVNDNIRIVFVYLGNNTVRFIAIGKHEEVYLD